MFEEAAQMENSTPVTHIKLIITLSFWLSGEAEVQRIQAQEDVAGAKIIPAALLEKRLMIDAAGAAVLQVLDHRESQRVSEKWFQSIPFTQSLFKGQRRKGTISATAI